MIDDPPVNTKSDGAHVPVIVSTLKFSGTIAMALVRARKTSYGDKLISLVIGFALILCAINGMRLGNGLGDSMKKAGSSRSFNDMDGMMGVATVIVIGTQKGGTEALNSFMEWHPDMITSIRKEPHWFDWRRSPNEASDGRIPEKDKYAYLKAYKEHAFNITETRSHLNKTMIDKTPFYMYDLKAAYRIKSVLPKAKIIALLRDPVERAYSHYKMDKRFYARNKIHSFEDCIEGDIAILKLAGVLSQNESAAETNLPDFDKAWARYAVTYRTYRLNCSSVVGRGIYAAQLRRWFKVYNKEEIMKQFLVMKSEDLRPDKYGRVDITNITRFIGISEKNFTNVGGIHETRDMGPMQIETKVRLRRLYKPFNDDLYELLGPGWENPWPYTKEISLPFF